MKDVPVVELERRRDLVTLELFYYWYNSKKKNKINYHKGSIINFKAILVVFPKDESGSSFIARYLTPPEQVNRFDFHEAASVPIKKNDFTDVKTFSGIVTEFRNFLKESP